MLGQGSCGGCEGCGGMALPNPPVSFSSVAPASSSSSSSLQSSAVAVIPTTPCKCGRLPWWWLLVAFLVGRQWGKGK